MTTTVDELGNQIVKKYTSDTSITLKQLSNEFNISTGRISRILKKHNIPIRHTPNIPDEQKELIIAKYINGASINSIANEYNWSPSSISRLISKTLPPSQRRSCQKKSSSSLGEELAKEYLTNDITHSALGKKYNISRALVTHRIKLALDANPEYKAQQKLIDKKTGAKRRKLSVTPFQLLLEIVSTGITQRELALKYHVSESCIYHALSKLKRKTGKSAYSNNQVNPKRKRNI